MRLLAQAVSSKQISLLGVPEAGDKKHKQWGPVQGTRQSIRVDLKGKTMLELAQDLQKRKNLEVPAPMHNKLQGLVDGLKTRQEMEADLPRIT